ncbi:hypothetical protein [Octadecabacter arcticus]|uniref:hypothetical protein n=1 Tax=Octadecabacter arcticus TaxID=53946 RepID=UPI0001809DFA|nr:hypothetical protein [Octadecabacter arcticus]
MKPNFALSLSFDGLRLMHRVSGGWYLVGQIALDDADLTGALDRLRAAADTLEPNGISTKILIPNDQIKYLALDTTRAEDDDVRQALHGATPYAVDDLIYDYAKGGGRTYVAAVAKETLIEARQFAAEHGFNPVSFAAVPEPFTYVGEVFFGSVDGTTVERDEDSVIVIGESAVKVAEAEIIVAEPDVPVDSVAEIEAGSQTDAAVGTDTIPELNLESAVQADAPQDLVAAFIPDVPDVAAPEPDAAPEPEADLTELVVDAPADVPTDAPEIGDESDIVPNTDDVEAIAKTTDAADTAPPMFASRLRADRTEGRPAPPQKTDTTPKLRAEPTFSRQTPPTLSAPPLSVPTGKGTDPMPPLSAPSRTADTPPVGAPIAQPITTNTPDSDVAPAITGNAPTALTPNAAIAAASLIIDPAPRADLRDDDDRGQSAAPDKPDEKRSAAAAALGAASTVGGAVGGMFASRRMARDDAQTGHADTPDEKPGLTVFGARTKPKAKAAVGGKPRFLGLILTAVLLLFLLAMAAVAALSEDGFARWFGFGPSETQMAADPTAPQNTAPEVAAPQAADGTQLADPAVAQPDNVATNVTPDLQTGGQVLPPEEAARLYAATGVWQRSPRIPQIPRTTTLDAMTLAVSPRPVLRVPSSPLASASSVAGDALIAAPIDPPPPSQTYDYNAEGLVVATPQGAITPDGILVIVGRPPLNPPTRPGTVAPVITPQDQLAAVIPQDATPLEDAPEGVIVIAGRPAIQPPIRTGTIAPVAAPRAAALASGVVPLVASDGLLVLTGSPPILPPVRAGTDPPQADVADLAQDIAAALTTNIAQSPTADTLRPLPRPAAVLVAAADIVAAQAVAANTPVLGALTVAQATAFRPRTRPAGLAPAQTPVPDPIPKVAQEVAVAPPTAAAPTGLQISPEIAAAVLAASNRPNPIVNPTALAVPVSSRPDLRPRNMARIVARANDARARAATQVATAAVAPQTVTPSGPTGGSVAQAATLDNAINLSEINLIGIYGGSGDRRALVRMGNGRYVRVTVGDQLDGGRVTAISAEALNYSKRGRAITLRVAG